MNRGYLSHLSVSSIFFHQYHSSQHRDLSPPYIYSYCFDAIVNGIFFLNKFHCQHIEILLVFVCNYVYCNFTKFTDQLCVLAVIGVSYIQNYVICKQRQFYFFFSYVDFLFLPDCCSQDLRTVLNRRSKSGHSCA